MMFGQQAYSESISVLINTSRGPLVDKEALYIALKEKWIAGAALDVMEEEPPNWESPLLKLDNLVFTPHISLLFRRVLYRVKDQGCRVRSFCFARKTAWVYCKSTGIEKII
jgi:phosphoglycerate dehydrogenase-like enzyme